MDYNSVFDIIGPIMVGPSSSHTAGAARIGKAVNTIFGGVPENVGIIFCGSFASTYKGHGSDVAVIGGVLGMDPSDSRIQHAYKIAEKEGLEVIINPSDNQVEFPNTILIHAQSRNVEPLHIVAISIGGGKIRVTDINGFKISLSCDNPTMLIFYKDDCTTISDITKIISECEINIGHMEMSRKSKGGDSLAIIEVDGRPDAGLIEKIEAIENVAKVKFL